MFIVQAVVIVVSRVEIMNISSKRPIDIALAGICLLAGHIGGVRGRQSGSCFVFSLNMYA